MISPVHTSPALLTTSTQSWKGSLMVMAMSRSCGRNIIIRLVTLCFCCLLDTYYTSDSASLRLPGCSSNTYRRNVTLCPPERPLLLGSEAMQEAGLGDFSFTTIGCWGWRKRCALFIGYNRLCHISSHFRQTETYRTKLGFVYKSMHKEFLFKMNNNVRE